MPVNLRELDKFLPDDFVKDIFIGMLQRLFMENPGEFHYDLEPEKSRIIISDQFRTDSLTPDFKPTIYTRRRPMGFMGTSIDKMFSMNMSTGARTFTDLITGVMELVAVSREGLEANRLAGLVFLLMEEFKWEFRKLGMHDVSVKTLGEEEPKDIKSTFRVVEVPVSIQYAFQYTWMLSIMNSTPLGEVTINKKLDPRNTCTPIAG